MGGNGNQIDVTAAGIPDAAPFFTSKSVELVCKRIPVYVIEMEDVCYHAGSGVLLPEDPAGTQEGESDTQTQKRVSGVAALALVFRYFEEAPDRRLLIVGHDDTEGSPKQGFDISKKRAEGVLYLLRGKKTEWSNHALVSHTIKDCQQIMRYYRFSRGWNCDPGAIDGQWGPKTEKATRAFFDSINKLGGAKKLDVNTVVSSKNKLWPVDVCGALYELYEHLMFSLLIGGNWKPEDAVKARNRLRFADENKPTVACGESFPVSHFGKENFRSQANRRVEFLFFNQDTMPMLPIKCPDTLTSNHTKEQCPLHKISNFKREYIKPDDINTTLYHIKFEYYDKVREEVCVVPEGLEIKAFKAGQPHVFSSLPKNGVYEVRLFNIPGGKRENDVHFSFETKNAWVYTPGKNSPPVIVYKFTDVDKSLQSIPITRDELAKLPLADQLHYYDLPEQWNSRNWFCNIDQKDGEFNDLVTEVTTLVAPLKFNLDNIVLTEKIGGSQEIYDSDHFGNKKKLTAGKSRIKLLYRDSATGGLKLYCKGPKGVTSRISFERNRVSENINQVMLVHFNNGFYTVGWHRSKVDDSAISKGFLVGARTAIREYPDKHISWKMKFNGNEFGYTGDYELHYFHRMFSISGRELSYAIIYASMCFLQDSRPANPQPPSLPSDADVKKFVDEGVYNAMEHWNKKAYYYRQENGNGIPLDIRILCFFDERETFTIDPAKRPASINFDQMEVVPSLFDHKEFIEARKNAFGGKPHFAALICEDNTPNPPKIKEEYGPAYAWPVRKEQYLFDSIRLWRKNYEYSLLKLNKSAYKNVTGMTKPDFINLVPVDEYGEKYGVFTFAHELGHASLGLPDEYIARNFKLVDPVTKVEYGFPSSTQFFEAYTMTQNQTSMMYHNGAPRLHHLHYQINMLLSEIGGKPLFGANWLTGRQYKIRFDYKGGKLAYGSKNGAISSPRDPRKPLFVDEKFKFIGQANAQSVYLALYLASQDEASAGNFHSTQKAQNIEYQAVLVLRLLLKIDFEGAWPIADAWRALDNLNTIASDRLAGKYCLVNGRNSFKNVFIHYLIGFSAMTATEPSNATIRFKHGTPAVALQPSPGTDTIVAFDNCTAEQILVHLMHLPDIATLNDPVKLMANLPFLKTWVDGKLGDTFELKQIP